MTRVAVIGIGAMGRNHARVYREMPEAELVAVVDADLDLAEAVGELYGAKAYSNCYEMVEHEQPDAVSVVVPTHAHYEVAMKLLEFGCHVLIEKPIAANLDQAGQLIAAAEARKRLLMVGHIERFNPAIMELKRRINASEIGRIFQINARRLGPFPGRVRDVGVIIDLATHDLDIMRFLTGSEAARVYAEVKREIHTSNEDMFSGMVRFASEALGILEINWLTPTKIREIYVTGERGMFRADYLTQDLYLYENADVRADGWAPMNVLRGVSEGAMIRFPIHRKEPLRAELEAFVAAIEGKDPTIPTGYDGQAALALALAMIEAAEIHQVREITQKWHYTSSLAR